MEAMFFLNRFFVFCLLANSIAGLSCLKSQEFVTLRSLQGVSIRAVVDKVEPDHVILRREDGVRFKSPLNLFDLNTRAYPFTRTTKASFLASPGSDCTWVSLGPGVRRSFPKN
jgi:hypothetical protein